MKADTVNFLVAELRLEEILGVACGNVFHEQIPKLVGKVRQHRSANGARRNGAQSGMQHHGVTCFFEMAETRLMASPAHL